MICTRIYIFIFITIIILVDWTKQKHWHFHRAYCRHIGCLSRTHTHTHNHFFNGMHMRHVNEWPIGWLLEFVGTPFCWLQPHGYAHTCILFIVCYYYYYIIIVYMSMILPMLHICMRGANKRVIHMCYVRKRCFAVLRFCSSNSFLFNPSYMDINIITYAYLFCIVETATQYV